MTFHHEKLIVYQRALKFAAWSQILIDFSRRKSRLAISWSVPGTALPLISRKVTASFRTGIERAFFRSRTALLWNQQLASTFLWLAPAVTRKQLPKVKRYW